MRAIKVAIADEDEGFRNALVDVLASDARISLTGVAATAEGIVSVVAATHPDLVLLGVRADAVDSRAALSVEQLSQGLFLHAGAIAPKTVVMSTQAKPAMVQALLSAGASGFVLKGRMDTHLAELLVRCARGEVLLAVSDEMSTDSGPPSGGIAGRAPDQHGEGASTWSVARSNRG